MRPKQNCVVKYFGSIIIFLSILYSCKKQDDWLNVKQNKSDVVPSTLGDFQALLDNSIMYTYYSELGLMGSDNYYVSYNNWNSSSAIERNSYVWASDIFDGSSSGDWNYSYQRISYANAVLDGLSVIIPDQSQQTNWDGIKGSALFFRAFAFYNLVQTFAKPYNRSSASTDLGIVLKLTADASAKSVRSSVQTTYQQIIDDLMQATMLLPRTAAYQIRPSQSAANALLARVYLNLDEYDSASKYATFALASHSALLDYNTLNSSSFQPFPTFGDNKEVIFYASSINFYQIISPGYKGIVDSNLYNSYDTNDLRKILFYSSTTKKFKGNYTSNYTCFAGLATDEVYLIRAESYARGGNIIKALVDLNTLLVNRWNAGTFIPVTTSDGDSVLSIILTERRKELPWTANLRWEDLRRLNKDQRFAITLTRILNGQTYTLSPNDNKYVYPIPPDEIKISGIQQNPR